MRDARRVRGQGGYTIVEVMVAMSLLVVGVLGMLIMVEGSLKSTSRTTAREQATNLAREVVERSRQIPYASTTTSAAASALAATLPETPAATGSQFVVRRRNVDYTAVVTTCSIDDPSDGVGVGDATFCAGPFNSTGPGGAPAGSGFAALVNVLGITVTLAPGGSLIDTLCSAIGWSASGGDTTIVNAVNGLLSSATGNGAQVKLCAAAPDKSVAYDANPDDLRRVRVRVNWTQGTGPASSLTQTTLLTTPT